MDDARRGKLSTGKVGPELLDAKGFRGAFDAQFRIFRQLFDDEMRRYGKGLASRSAPFSEALEFAKDLMLCPTEEAVQARIGKNLEASRVIYIAAPDLRDFVEVAYAQCSIQAWREQTPFFTLAYVLHEWLSRQNGESRY